MLTNPEGEHIKTALKELEPFVVNGQPMISLKSVLRILTNFRENNDHWDLVTSYANDDERIVWWVGSDEGITKAKAQYEAEFKAKQEAKKKPTVNIKPSFLSSLFGRKSKE